jgi:hypothetical protein
MYSKILLAYDGSVDSRLALREGAKLAQLCQADVFLLAVVNPSTGMMLAEGASPGAVETQRESFQGVLAEGVQRLEAMSFVPAARLAFGDRLRKSPPSRPRSALISLWSAIAIKARWRVGGTVPSEQNCSKGLNAACSWHRRTSPD